MMKHLLQCAAVALTVGAASGAMAQGSATDYPGSKTVRMVVPFPPGGGTDILSRIIAQKLSEQNHWTVVADNRAGAGGTIGISEVAKAQPTGYDIVMGQKDNVVLGYYLYKGLPWNPRQGPDAHCPCGLLAGHHCHLGKQQVQDLERCDRRRQGRPRRGGLRLVGRGQPGPPGRAAAGGAAPPF